MLTRLLPAAALAAVLALSGCGVLPGLPIPGEKPEVAAAEVGDCLDGMIGFDSDRNAIVDCDGPHLYEITAIEEWPGLAAALETAGDAGRAWDDINLSEEVSPYWRWASTTCSSAARDALGIDDVEVQGHTAADLWLTVGGPYGVDLSLPSRSAFLAGDHRTICSVAWYDAEQNPRTISYDDGLRFADITAPGFDSALHDCWDEGYTAVDCARPHYGQALASFDALVAFGDEFVERAADAVQTEEDWTLSDAFCVDLVGQVLPQTAPLDGLVVIADIDDGAGWDTWSGSVDPDYPYPFACLATAPGFAPLTGDVFAGDIEVLPVPGSPDDGET